MALDMGTDSPKGYQWVAAVRGYAPPNAVVGGDDNEEPLYIGRALHQGALTPGRVQSSQGCCYIGWGEKEHSYRKYEVLCELYEAESGWQKDRNGHSPEGAIPGGHSETGETLYIGRCMHSGSMVPGKVQRSHRCIYIPYGGKEHPYRNYEVLVNVNSTIYE